MSTDNQIVENKIHSKSRTDSIMEERSILLRTGFDDKHFIVSSFTNDSMLDFVLKNHNLWEYEVTSLLQQLVKKDYVCIDIGANIGLTSLILGYLAIDGQVYSFEPVYHNILKKNIEMNSMTNITPINIALSNQNSELNFVTHDKCSGWAGTAGVADKNIKVHAMRFDDYIKQYNLEKIDLIKIDIEGHELFALEGAKSSLKKWKPDLIIEFFNNHPVSKDNNEKDLFDFLRNHYEKISIITSGGLIEINNYHDLKNLPIILNFYCTNNTRNFRFIPPITPIIYNKAPKKKAKPKNQRYPKIHNKINQSPVKKGRPKKYRNHRHSWT